MRAALQGRAAPRAHPGPSLLPAGGRGHRDDQTGLLQRGQAQTSLLQGRNGQLIHTQI